MTKLADLIWKNAELLRGAFKENECRQVILRSTILRRLDCVLQPSLEAVHTKTKLSAKALELVRKGVGTRDKTTELCTNEKGEVLSDLELRDAEYVPLHEDINRYFARLYAAAQPCGDSGGKKLLAELFGVDVRTISEHFGKLSGSGELAEA